MHIIYNKNRIENFSKKKPVSYIVICCCTYKRPQKLERLLKNLCSITYPENIKTEILVADNDKEKSAEKIVQKFKGILPVHYTADPRQGLSNIRNKALKEAEKLGASHIAFIDDDEIADKNWLVNHIDFYNKFENIYISSGPTYKKFHEDYPDYIINNVLFSTVSSKQLGELKKTCASGNVFLPLDIVEKNNIYFCEKFNFSGSEDTDFFSRLREAGYNIGWNFNAINFEIIDKERASIKWILKRSFHNGYSVSLVRFYKNKNIFKRAVYILEKFFTILLNILTIIFSMPFGITKTLNSITRFIKNCGKLSGAIILKERGYYGEQYT